MTNDLDDTLQGELEDLAGQVEGELRKQFFGKGLRGISPGVEHQLESGGKRLRPVLGQWFGRRLEADPEPVARFSLAVELLHNVLLIHDDIEDGDRYRRERKTLWVERGLAEALNVADFLLAEALLLVPASTPGLHESFARVLRQTVIGQAGDLAERGAPDFTLGGYEEIIRRKTGEYLVLSWYAAARIAGVSRNDADRLWLVGDELGPAFQIRDDLLDLSAGKGRGGEIGCDVKEGKPSILYAFALERLPEGAERDELIEITARPRETTTSEQVDRAITLYHDCGAVEFAESECQRRLRAGVETFQSLSWIPVRCRDEFPALAARLTKRKV